jgi:hypothetical protein
MRKKAAEATKVTGSKKPKGKGEVAANARKAIE